MIELAYQPWFLLSLCGLLLLGMGLVVLLLALQVRELRRRDQARETAVESLQNLLRARPPAPARGPDEHQLRLARQFDELRARQERLELQAMEAHGYHQAIDWVRRGADVDQLVRQLGLSRGEAELLQALHRAREAG